MKPAPFPPQQKSGGNYFVGLGLGSIPLVFFLISIGTLLTSYDGSGFFILAIVFYILLLFAVIACLIRQSTRFVGYGLLTAFLVTPVVVFIGCTVVISHIHL